MTTLTPRIYVACLACYNAGHLVGEWWDMDDLTGDGYDEWQKEHQDATGHEDYLVHDCEGFGYSIGEVSVPHAIELGEFIEEHDAAGAVALSHFCGDLEQARTAMEESYQGAHDSIEAWAQDFAEQCFDLEKLGTLAQYIDWERYARDCEMGDVWSEKGEDGQVHVFSSH